MTQGDANRQHICINILDDDSLLNIFYHSRPPVLFVEGDDDGINLCGGTWECEYWWYKISWVCRRWRRLIHASPSYLGISLVCRSGISLSDMLAHSPPFPLIIDHIHRFETNPTEVEGRILLALNHRDRVRCIRLQMQESPSERLMKIIDKEFPLLEYLYIRPPGMMVLRPDSNLSLPSTLRAPHLRHLVLFNFNFPVGSPLLSGLVTLSLEDIAPSANFCPNELLQQLSFMPPLETFVITFFPPLFSQDFRRELWQIPLSTQCILPNLRWFGFEGRSAYMEAVLPRITMPLLKVTEIVFVTSHPLTLASSIIFALQSMYKTENPRLSNVKVKLDKLPITLVMYPQQSTSVPTLRVDLSRLDVNRILGYTAQLFDGIRTVLTEVEVLTLEGRPLTWGIYRSVAFFTSLHGILWPFIQVRTLHLSDGDIVEELCLFLLPHEGEPTIELLPMLRVLSCPKGTHVGESCRSFLAARQNAGFPVTISYR